MEDIDKLLEIASINIDSDDKLSEAQQYCIARNILNGFTLIAAKEIYQDYIEWRKPQKPQNETRFFKDFSKLLKSKRTAKGRFYLIDLDASNLNVGGQNEKKEKKP